MGRQSRIRPTQHDAEETRRAILHVAQQLFMEYGYRAVSTRQLADACGLTQPALYHYFSDKQELYLAMLVEELSKISAALERIATRRDTVAERLKSMATYLMARTSYDLSLMIHDIRYELSSQAREGLDKQFYTGFILPIASVFEDGLKQGILRPVDQGGMAAVSATYLFMSMLARFTGQARRGIALPDQHTPASYAELVVQVLLYGLHAPGSST